jgi:peptidoglycan/LPS O-acetylase OafA/YrhL
MRDMVLGGGAPGRVQVGRRLAVGDALRALAALLVMFGHTGFGAYRDRWWWPLVEPIWINGGTGVGLFLVLSGFSIHLRWAARTADEGAFPVGRFWRRRFVRLYPTYWAALGLCLALLVLAEGPDVFHRSRPFFWGGTQPVWVALVTHLVVVTANLVPATFIVRAWSLALEEQIYGVYAVVQRWMRSVSSLHLLIGAFVVSMCSQFVVQLVTDWVPLQALRGTVGAPSWEIALFFQLPTRGFEWILGMVVAEWWVGRRPLRVLTSRSVRPIVAVAVVALSGGAWFRFHSPAFAVSGRAVYPTDALVNGIFALGYVALLVALLLREEELGDGRLSGPILRGAAAVGLFSYSLYLLHPPVLELVERRSRLPLMVSIPVQWAAALAISWVFFLLVERRFIARAGRVGRVSTLAATTSVPVDG